MHPPPAPQPVAGALCFCSLAGDLAKRRSARAKERWPRARSAPRSKPVTGGPAAGVGAPRKQRRVLLRSAGNAMSCSVPCRPESTMLRDRSSSAHVLLWFLGTEPSPQECSCLKPRREDRGRWCVGRAVAWTLADVMLSYFKIFYLGAL